MIMLPVPSADGSGCAWTGPFESSPVQPQCQSTLSARFETGGEGLKRTTIEVLQRALESAGVEFIDENGGGPGVRLRKRQPRKD